MARLGRGLAGPLAVEEAVLPREVTPRDCVQGKQQARVLGGGQRHPAAQRKQQVAADEEGRRVNLGAEAVGLPVVNDGTGFDGAVRRVLVKK